MNNSAKIGQVLSNQWYNQEIQGAENLEKTFGLTWYLSISILGGCPSGVMVKAMDCGIVVRKFVQSCNYVHFRANTLGKGMNPVILPAMG